MRITLDGLDGHGFSLSLLGDDGDVSRGHRVEIHSTKSLGGVYEHTPKVISLDPVKADEIVGAVVLSLATGRLELGGPMRLSGVDLDVDFSRGEGGVGAGTAAIGEAKILDFRYEGAGGAIEGAITARGLHARHSLGAGFWKLDTEGFDVDGLAVTWGSVSLTASGMAFIGTEVMLGDDPRQGLFGAREGSVSELGVSVGKHRIEVKKVTVTGLTVARGEDGGVRVEVTELEVGEVKIEGEWGELLLGPTVKVRGVKFGPTGLTAEGLQLTTVGVRWQGSDEEKKEAAKESQRQSDTERDAGERRLGVDLQFLDGLNGTLAADVTVDVRVPVIKRRVATYRLRAQLEDGAVNFKELEGGLSFVEDALIDFAVRGRALVLELGVLFKRRVLLSWPLDEEGLARALGDRVLLRSFARPVVPAKASAEDHGEESEGGGNERSSVGVERLTVEGLLAEVRVKGASVLELSRGAVLRFGSEGVDFVKSLRVSGGWNFDATVKGVLSEVIIEANGVRAGLEALRLGERELTLKSVGVESLSEAKVVFRDGKPAGVTGVLGGVVVSGVAWRANGGV